MPSEQKPKPESPDDDVTVTVVAFLLKKRYHKARDLMLTGKLGESKYSGRELTVKRGAVEKYRRQEQLQKEKRS